MNIGLLGKKIGMTSIYDATGKLRPVTVIAAGDNVLLRRVTTGERRLLRRQGRLRHAEGTRVNKALLGEFKKAGSEPKKFDARVSPRRTMRRKARST